MRAIMRTKPLVTAALIAVAGCGATWKPLLAADTNPETAGKCKKVDARIYAAWQAVRQLDCARCHGADWNGSVGPSIVQYMKNQPKESFTRIVLEGDVPRGMPGYKSTPRIADNIDAIYDYFKGVATGEIPTGKLVEPE